MKDAGYTQAGQFIRDRREHLGLTQQDVVDALRRQGIQTSPSAIGRLEKGDGGRLNLGDADFVNALARALRLDPEDLLQVTGHLRARKLVLDTRTQRILELVSQMDADTLYKAEEILKILANQQDQRERG